MDIREWVQVSCAYYYRGLRTMLLKVSWTSLIRDLPVPLLASLPSSFSSRAATLAVGRL